MSELRRMKAETIPAQAGNWSARSASSETRRQILTKASSTFQRDFQRVSVRVHSLIEQMLGGMDA